MQNCKIHHSVVGLRSCISEGAIIEDTLLMGADYYEVKTDNFMAYCILLQVYCALQIIYHGLIGSSSKYIYLILSSLFQTDADRRFLAAKGSVPIGIGKNSHIKRAIIDKNARIGDNVKVFMFIARLIRTTLFSILQPKVDFFFFNFNIE